MPGTVLPFRASQGRAKTGRAKAGWTKRAGISRDPSVYWDVNEITFHAPASRTSWRLSRPYVRRPSSPGTNPSNTTQACAMLPNVSTRTWVTRSCRPVSRTSPVVTHARKSATNRSASTPPAGAPSAIGETNVAPSANSARIAAQSASPPASKQNASYRRSITTSIESAPAGDAVGRSVV